jgi:hypothetical protein
MAAQRDIEISSMSSQPVKEPSLPVEGTVRLAARLLRVSYKKRLEVAYG